MNLMIPIIIRTIPIILTKTIPRMNLKIPTENAANIIMSNKINHRKHPEQPDEQPSFSIFLYF
jgi:hypothetical protein